MGLLSMLKPSFTAGELSPNMYARVDMAKYDSGCKLMQNFLVMMHGGAKNRPGTLFLGKTKNNNKPKLIPFRFSVDQNYILEFTPGFIRFYAEGGIIESGGVPYEVITPYTDVSKLKYTQSNDMLFLLHPDHKIMVLTRYSHTDWTLEEMDVSGGPFKEAVFSSSNVYIGHSYYVTAGSYTFTAPFTGTYKIEVAGPGGGSSGYGEDADGHASPVMAGGQGASTTQSVELTEGDICTVVVGTPGTKGADDTTGQNFHHAGNGTNGTTSSFTINTISITAQGGGGGIAGYFLESPNGESYISSGGRKGTSYGSGGLGGYRYSAQASHSTSEDIAAQPGWIKIRWEINKTDSPTIIASALEGDISLTASKAVFSKEHIGCLIRIGQTISSQYTKGVPKSDETTPLVISATPNATVYAESFGFWNGDWSLQEYNSDTGSWDTIRKIDGNRSENYKITHTNLSEEIKNYRIISTLFDISVWTGENANQRGFITLQTFANDYFGIARITGFTDTMHVSASVTKNLGKLAATTNWSFGYWNDVDGYPTCATFYQDRLVAAANKNYPQTFWTSKTGDYFNFGTSLPTVDDDAITAPLNAGQLNKIKALCPFSEIIMLTSGGEFKVSASSGIMTPSDIKSDAQEYRGISDVDPVIVGSKIVYVQQQGNAVRDLYYRYDVDKYTGDDLTLLAKHLFNGYTITAIAYQQIPDSIIWCVRNDGMLLGLTYLREQEVYAWHRHPTDGFFVDCCVIPGSKQDILYLAVERNGEYMVEMMAEQNTSEEVKNQYFVDSGLIYEGEPVSSVSGLDHLKGKTISILADGNVLAQQIVPDNGTINLGNEYSKVIAGLPIDAVFIPLPPDINSQSGTYLAKKKRIETLSIFFSNSLGGRYGCSEASMDEIKWRSAEAYGKAIELYSGTKTIKLPSATYKQDATVVIKQPDPLPLTILAIIPEVTPGG